MPGAVLSDPADFRSNLAELYSANHRWLRGWIYRRVQCPDDAADLAQDTFLKALGAPQLPSLKEPRAFLATVARHLLINLFRRRALERAYLEELALQADGYVLCEEERLLAREALEQIDRLLDGVPTRARHVFILHRLEGLSQPTIAAQLNLSLATVERDLRRAYLHCLSERPE